MFVNYLVKQFAIILGVVVVMEELSVGVCNLLDRPCMVFQRLCVRCAFRCSFHRFRLCLCFIFKSLRAGSQVFALLILFHCVIHNMWLGKSLHLLCILP